jgi:hypothetical protein
MFDFLRILIRFFDSNKISYMLSGSMAMSTYTEPRFTRDFDFIVHLNPSDALVLANYFNDGYYCDKESITEAIQQKTMFNIIDHKSNYKADFIILKDEPYRKVEFERRKLIDFLDIQVFLVSPEDLLISKIIWVQHLQSSLQMEDIRLLAALENMDWAYIWRWVTILKLNTFDIIKK